MINFKNKKILITGGSFIGFHLIKKLIDLGVSHIRIVNLTNKNKKILIKNFKDIEFYAYDLEI